ncbi:hypothetical protein FB45DRAFT_894758 [Roridomyces roridus]|uniref:DUF5648 domain-containing protein n=1 Tax=Roridomyces roridus TaxID=1738132 RepID=A0AAD7CGI5_9AGAR|nr:hypothetical protein FB45DRAFT_894758 [Roridomyces roridus]
MNTLKFFLATVLLVAHAAAIVIHNSDQVVLRLDSKGAVVCPQSKPQKLYRLFNADIEHFFLTTSDSKISAAQADGYEIDGVAAHVFHKREPSTVPLYHLYNERTENHFFTHDELERNAALDDEGFEYHLETPIAGYLFPRRMCGAKPLWRLVKDGHHGLHRFYTTDPYERDAALVNEGYIDAGVAGYVH